MEQMKYYRYSDLTYTQLLGGNYIHNYHRDFQLLIVDMDLCEIKEIFNSIPESFRLVEEIAVNWSCEYYKENSRRLFDGKLTLKSFTVYIFEDLNPSYRQTFSKKIFENINSSSYLNKLLKYSKIYLSKNISDFFRLGSLIFGLELLKKIIYSGVKAKDLEKDILGHRGWKDFQEFIEIANTTSNWLVLRNFEYLPNDFFENDKDVDVLCDDLEFFARSMNLTKRSWGIGAFQTVIAQEVVPFDVRFLGDDYYDKLWQYHMLESKVFNPHNVPRLDALNYFFSLLYHSKIQKLSIKKAYEKRLLTLASEIGLNDYKSTDIYDNKKMADLISNFLLVNNYVYSNPKDTNVIKNKKVLRLLSKEVVFEKAKSRSLKRDMLELLPKKLYSFIPNKLKINLKRLLNVE